MTDNLREELAALLAEKDQVQAALKEAERTAAALRRRLAKLAGQAGAIVAQIDQAAQPSKSEL